MLAYAVSTGPAHGTLALDAATGAYTYTPGANFNGSDSFKVAVADPSGASAVQTVTVGVAAVNDAPVANAAASLSTSEDTAISGQVLASDVDGDVLAYAVSTGPAHGTLALDAATGAYTYTGATNFSGADSFKVLVADGHGGTASQTINVSVGAVADAPLLAAGDVTAAAGITIDGTGGADTLRGTSGDDLINGGAGDDVLYGNGGTMAMKTVALAIGASLTDTDGSETLSVTIAGVPASASLSAGVRGADGVWTLSGAQLSGLSVTASTSSNFALTITAKSTEAAGGSAQTVAALKVTFDPGTDSDTIDGGAGNDKIYGGSGNNVLIDGDGNDLAYGNGGNDLFKGGLGNDTYDGGAGFDTIDFSLATGSVQVDLAKNTASGMGTDKLASIEAAVGSAFDDTLTGSASDNRIEGGLGNDTISGGAGNDTLYGGDGNDKIDGGSGNDVIYDGAGDDTVTAGDGDDYIYAGSGLDKYTGGNGFDTLDYSNATGAITVDASKKTVLGFTSDTMDGIEKVVGSKFDDSFTGGKTSNFFDGGAGNDSFRGMGGADTYTGGTGKDTYNWFVKDVVSGNTFLGADVITDFKSGEDKLNLHEFVKAFPGANIDTIVKMTDSAVGSLMSVKIGTVFQDLVMLQGIHGETASSLLAKGDILT